MLNCLDCAKTPHASEGLKRRHGVWVSIHCQECSVFQLNTCSPPLQTAMQDALVSSLHVAVLALPTEGWLRVRSLCVSDECFSVEVIGGYPSLTWATEYATAIRLQSACI
eukprot:2166696-Amphidinium_carterae.1